MTFYNKIKWALGVLLVFVLILATNLMDRQNFLIVRESLETIYDDRLIAKDIILDVSTSLHEKELNHLQLSLPEFQEKNQRINTNIDALISQFSTTKLTQREKVVFSELKGNFATLKNIEKTLIEPSEVADFKAQLLKLKVNLGDLSDIQVREGRRQLMESQKAITAADLFTRLEIYALIVIAIAIQVIILYPSSKSEN